MFTVPSPAGNIQPYPGIGVPCSSRSDRHASRWRVGVAGGRGVGADRQPERLVGNPIGAEQPGHRTLRAGGDDGHRRVDPCIRRPPRRRPGRRRAPASPRPPTRPRRRPRRRRRSVRHRAAGAATPRRGSGSGRWSASRARGPACRRSCAVRRCGARRADRSSSSSSAPTARGVRPSPHTLSRPSGALLEHHDRCAGTGGADRGGRAGRPAADRNASRSTAPARLALARRDSPLHGARTRRRKPPSSDSVDCHARLIRHGRGRSVGEPPGRAARRPRGRRSASFVAELLGHRDCRTRRTTASVTSRPGRCIPASLVVAESSAEVLDGWITTITVGFGDKARSPASNRFPSRSSPCPTAALRAAQAFRHSDGRASGKLSPSVLTRRSATRSSSNCSAITRVGRSRGAPRPNCSPRRSST